jgi:hypothetical protein
MPVVMFDRVTNEIYKVIIDDKEAAPAEAVQSPIKEEKLLSPRLIMSAGN